MADKCNQEKIEYWDVTEAAFPHYFQNNMQQYAGTFTESGLWHKVMAIARKAGLKVIYMVLLLYYSLQNPAIPKKVKSVILGALGYFIMPFDMVPDALPMLGYGDDWGVLLAALAYVAVFIDDEVRQKSRERLKQWFGDYSVELLDAVDTSIDKSAAANSNSRNSRNSRNNSNRFHES